jgi:hypothetical protein
MTLNELIEHLTYIAEHEVNGDEAYIRAFTQPSYPFETNLTVTVMEDGNVAFATGDNNEPAGSAAWEGEVVTD